MSEDVHVEEPQFLVHKDGDHVAVTVRDLTPGVAHGFVLASDRSLTVEVKDSVPLGHKFALTELSEGDAVIEYGIQVGLATSAIGVGQYVHTHNVRSARWQRSVAL